MAKVFIEETTLTAIGDAIREKEGTTALVPVNDMATRISAIQGGGAGGYEIPEEAFTITDNGSYKFAYNNWNWFINNYGNKITTKDLSTVHSMFVYADELESIPFDINLKVSTYGCVCDSLFSNMKNLKVVPYVTGTLTECRYLFNNCLMLREIPEDWADKIDCQIFNKATNTNCNYIFNNCYSLRHIPSSLLSKLWCSSASTAASYVTYNLMFSGCHVLDEARGIGVQQGSLTSNRSGGFVSGCNRVKSVTFATNADGSAKTAKWKSQVLDFSSNVGWGTTAADITTRYNSGITADKQVTDDATYQALKNDPDWFTLDVAYSRYNHDSAVETINSLPDTSATGTNTIKFKKASGSATDGGAIENLTAEEIAVATAKGWTVTLA